MFHNATLHLSREKDGGKSRPSFHKLKQTPNKWQEMSLDGLAANYLRIEGSKLRPGSGYQAIAEIELFGCLDVVNA